MAAGEQFDSINAIPLIEVPSYVPGRPAIQTVWRWILQGVRGPNGETIKLRSFKVAGKRFVARGAIEDFIRAWNSDAPVGESDAERTRRAKAACAKLEAVGA